MSSTENLSPVIYHVCTPKCEKDKNHNSKLEKNEKIPDYVRDNFALHSVFINKQGDKIKITPENPDNSSVYVNDKEHGIMHIAEYPKKEQVTEEKNTPIEKTNSLGYFGKIVIALIGVGALSMFIPQVRQFAGKQVSKLAKNASPYVDKIKATPFFKKSQQIFQLASDKIKLLVKGKQAAPVLKAAEPAVKIVEKVTETAKPVTKVISETAAKAAETVKPVTKVVSDATAKVANIFSGFYA